LGTETDGSITCPINHNNLAGIKPTVGLTSRAGGMKDLGTVSSMNLT
jgi:amidase